MKKLDKSITMLLGYVGFIGILIISAGVLTRFFLKLSISWSDELLRTIFVWGYFIGAAMCYKEGGIMRLELVDDALRKHHHLVAQKYLTMICECINLAFFGVSTYFVCVICLQHAAHGTTSGTSNTPAWVLPLSYGVGSAIITVLAIRNLIRAIRSKSEPAQEDLPEGQ